MPNRILCFNKLFLYILWPLIDNNLFTEKLDCQPVFFINFGLMFTVGYIDIMTWVSEVDYQDQLLEKMGCNLNC